MRLNARTVILIICISMVSAWLGHRFIPYDNKESVRRYQDDVERPATTAATAYDAASAAVTSGAAAPESSGNPQDVAEAGVAEAPVAPFPGRNPNDSLVTADYQIPPGDVSGNPIPPKKPLQDLLKLSSVTCEFSPTNGALWRDGKVKAYSGGAWAGGPVIFDTIDVDAGTARIVGNPTFTGSQTGEMQMRVAATSTGLHLSGFTKRGDLIAATVFGGLDASGNYIAVISKHQSLSHNVSQIYGGCR